MMLDHARRRLLAACFAGAAPAEASNYEFLAAPQINLSLVYRLDKLTGEIIACQYGHNPGKTDIEPGAFGVTVCYRGGRRRDQARARRIWPHRNAPRTGGRRVPRRLPHGRR